MTLRRKARLKWLAAKRSYYTRRYGFPVSMLPLFGDGRFVSVHQRGPFLDMRDEQTGDTVRLVPYQPNHGVMVEMWRDGRLAWRSHCDVDAFARMGFDRSERAA